MEALTAAAHMVQEELCLMREETQEDRLCLAREETEGDRLQAGAYTRPLFSST
jgi:hypothetical protein